MGDKDDQYSPTRGRNMRENKYGKVGREKFHIEICFEITWRNETRSLGKEIETEEGNTI